MWCAEVYITILYPHLSFVFSFFFSYMFVIIHTKRIQSISAFLIIYSKQVYYFWIYTYIFIYIYIVHTHTELKWLYAFCTHIQTQFISIWRKFSLTKFYIFIFIFPFPFQISINTAYMGMCVWVWDRTFI